MNSLPVLYFMVGLPGSGKSTWIKENFTDVKICSSDEIRKELIGDENAQSKNTLIFETLHNRIKQFLLDGKSVVYDATNISKKRRILFLKSIENIPCIKICIVIATPYPQCVKNNLIRERKVPVNVIKKMYTNWQPPHETEGWDSILIKYPFAKSKDISFIVDLEKYDQKNSHHKLSLGKHLQNTFKFINDIAPEDENLAIAAALHDIGKPFTRKIRECDGEAHYYNHHCVGAYESMFYYDEPLNDKSVLDRANLIYYHMHPFMSWKTSKKAFMNDSVLLGQDMIKRIKLLHMADRAAH